MSGRPMRSRGGGRNGNGYGDQMEGAASVSGNTEIGFFTSRSRGGGGGGPMRDSRGRGSNRRGRGGIRSTASLPPRPSRGEDLDGDLSMGGEKKNFSPYQRPAPARNTRSSTSSRPMDRSGTTVVVFVRTKNYNERSGGISFTVEDLAQAKSVRALTGIRYKQSKLLVKTSEDEMIQSVRERETERPSPPASRGTIESIRTFLKTRYNNGFLNLENMSKDEILRNARIIPPGQNKGRSDVGAVMIKAASQMFPDITTISFANNGLTTLQSIALLPRFFPNLQNLSLKDNDIASFKELEYFGGKKLSSLRELILQGNPIHDRDIKQNKDDLNYRSEITKIFPSITILDQVPVAPKISFGLGDLIKANIKPALPAPIKGNFFDNPGTQSTVLEFLTRYLELYDSNRSALEHVYDNNATFSYSAVPLASPLQKIQGKQPENWGGYTSQSRNLSRIKDLAQRTARLYFGSRDIIEQGVMKLPETRHDLADASRVCVDAWQTGGLLPSICIYIMLHGEFEEVRRGQKGIQKSFDRSFIVAPAPAASSAAMNGWKCIIISDQLIIRGYNGCKNWKPEEETIVAPTMAPSSAFTPSLSAAVASVAAAVSQQQQQAPMEGVSPEQHAAALNLQKLTSLNYPYAVQCLMASGWDVTKGVALVNENRASIPQDAWQQPNF
ncbi:nuclear mRNA export, poly(A)+RNA binding protein [Entomortierella beljakovae]|nr:nuclear mRNA export, poly(A)+RNA binding protein [Entomortierella beljakovae]